MGLFCCFFFSGASIEKLCEAVFDVSINDRASVIRAARCLLNSVTRVLLLADVVVVKQLISVKDKVRGKHCFFERSCSNNLHVDIVQAQNSRLWFGRKSDVCHFYE